LWARVYHKEHFAMAADTTRPARRFRSRDWFDDPTRIDQSAIYLERFMNYGVTPEELRSGKPISVSPRLAATWCPATGST
jgi:hypothetical protein